METFVPFNIANKLKEKGFTLGYNIYGYKPIYSDVNTIKFIWDIGGYEKDYFGENIPCPTIEQILKWLRDEKNLFVYPETVHLPEDERLGEHSGKRMWDFSVDDLNIDDCIFESRLKYHSYEEAAIAGIEWVLNNLI
jgi:hypothetical protein